jgi:hypothetical protein
LAQVDVIVIFQICHPRPLEGHMSFLDLNHKRVATEILMRQENDPNRRALAGDCDSLQDEILCVLRI